MGLVSVAVLMAAENGLKVWFICLTAYQLLMGYLMPKFDSFLNVWLEL